MKLNIYQFDFGNDVKDWVIATSKKNAILIHRATTDMDYHDYHDVNISFLKKKDWKYCTYFNEEKEMSFAEFMENEAFEECFFCSTEY